MGQKEWANSGADPSHQILSTSLLRTAVSLVPFPGYYKAAQPHRQDHLFTLPLVAAVLSWWTLQLPSAPLQFLYLNPFPHLPFIPWGSHTAPPSAGLFWLTLG